MVSLLCGNQLYLLAQSLLEFSPAIAATAEGNHQDWSGCSAGTGFRVTRCLRLAVEGVRDPFSSNSGKELAFQSGRLFAQAEPQNVSARSCERKESRFLRIGWGELSLGIPGSALAVTGSSPAGTPAYPSAFPFRTEEPNSCANLVSSSKDPGQPVERFRWGSALLQSFEFLLVIHGGRLAMDAQSRDLLTHRPFWHDWWVSTKSEVLTRWGDGDSFVVNYIGHPLQGAISGYIQIQNDPRGRALKIGRSSEYWKSRLKATAWAAVFSAQLEAGPILSEAAIGNEGGFSYVHGCPPDCRHPETLTNGTGLMDWVITPVIGLGWILVEDSMEKYVVDRLAGSNPKFRYKVLLGALNPARTMANVLQGKLPWYRYSTDQEPFTPTQKTPFAEYNHAREQRLSVGNRIPLFQCESAHGLGGVPRLPGVQLGFRRQHRPSHFPKIRIRLGG